MTYREQDIIDWGTARNLIGPTGEATSLRQAEKTQEEAEELKAAAEAWENKKDLDSATKAVCDARDAIGDIYVTLVMNAQLWGFSMEECIDAAWNEIKDRKGRMVNGVFVKSVLAESQP